MNGILNILKPTGMTSHDVVSSVRKILNTKKVGHAGTLDPNVAGVMVICVGKGTKISDYLMNGDKEYICELILGKSTDTQDSYGEDVLKNDSFSVSREDVVNVLKEFLGEQLQIPPMYSAVKLNGKKLYEYARQNIQVEKPGKLIEINITLPDRYDVELVLPQGFRISDIVALGVEIPYVECSENYIGNCIRLKDIKEAKIKIKASQ